MRLGGVRHAVLPVAILAAAMALVATGVIPVAAGFFGAAVLVVASGALRMREAYAALEAPVLVLVAALIPVSDTVQKTGGADLIAGWLSGAFHGLPPIATLTAMFLARGLCYVISIESIPIRDAFFVSMSRSRVTVLPDTTITPSVIIALSTVAIAFFVLHKTRFGRTVYAIGGNEEAAVLSGIAVDRIIIGAYVLMGVTVALTGFMMTAYSGASTTTVGDLMELDAIDACVIGGTALKGGRGTVWGVLFGALIMTALLNGMTLLAISPELKYIARGTVLALAVWMDVKLASR